MGDLVAAFLQRLTELGWMENRNVSIEYRWAEGRNDRAAEIAAEFVRLNVDLIVTGGTANVLAAKDRTSVIPIVFAAAGDPVGNGLVGTLARPGGNVTGLSNQSTDLAGKQLQLLRDVVSDLRRVAILVNMGSPIGGLDLREVQAGASLIGLEVTPLEIRREEDIATAFETLNGRADALFVAPDPLVNSNPIVSTSWPWMRGFRPCMAFANRCMPEV